MSQNTDPDDVTSALSDDAEFETLSSAVLLRSDRTEVLRLIVPAVQTIRTDHGAAVEVVIQCLRGAVILETASGSRALKRGDVTLLASGKPHALHGVENAVILSTIVRNVPVEHHHATEPIRNEYE